MNPFINPNKRGVTLPSGCKDLIDVIGLEATVHDFKTAFTEAAFVITASLSGLKSEDVEIIVEGTGIRIIGKKAVGNAPFESVIHIPSGYNVSDARAAFLKGELRITIPKSAA